MREALLTQELQRVDGASPGSGLPKHHKMTTSPFVFYRGSAQVFYADLANGTLRLPPELLSLPLTTVMGDCHTSNFGFLTEEGSHGDTVIFSPNDFDDACVGHAAWDWLRYCVSLVLCVEHCQGVSRGLIPYAKDVKHKPVVSYHDAVVAIEAFFDGYLSVCLLGLSGESHLNHALQHIKTPTSMKKRYAKARQRAAGGDAFLTQSTLAKAVAVDQFPLAFVPNAEKFSLLDKPLYRQLEHAFAPYMDDKILDIVERRNAGTGSVNMKRYYFLVGPEGLNQAADIPLCHLVEVKQQREAAPVHHFPDISPNNRLNPAHLTVMCQQRMQRNPDLILDEAQWQGAHWLIRSRHHAKVGFDPEHLGFGKNNVEGRGFVQYAENCGQALALAHCRGDRRSLLFEQAVCEQLPTHMYKLKSLALAYAEQVNRDHQWLSRLDATPTQ